MCDKLFNFSKGGDLISDILKVVEDNTEWDKLETFQAGKEVSKHAFNMMTPQEYKMRIVSMYKYERRDGSTSLGGSRPFCSQLMARTTLSDKFILYRNIPGVEFDDVISESILQLKGTPNGGPNGWNNYDVFKYRGSLNCRHIFVRYTVDTETGNYFKSDTQPDQPYPIPRWEN